MTKSEAQTRVELIDEQLARAAWNVKDPSQVIEEFDILTGSPDGAAEPRTTYGGRQFSDYVLLGKDRKPLAVIEAKKPAATQRLVGSKQNSIATTFKSNWVVNCRFASTQTATNSISGIWRTRLPAG